MKRGAPTKYRSEMCDDLVDKMAKGWYDCEIFASWDISKDTFYRWLNENQEFKEAYERGLPKSEAHLIGVFRQLMSGDLSSKHAFNAAIALANNKHKWSRNTGPDTQTQININNMNVLQHQSKDELTAFITSKIQELELLPNDTRLIESKEQEPTRTIEDSGSS